MSEVYYGLSVAGLVMATVLTRSFFFLPSKPWPLPSWAEKGLRYAPLAALTAVVVPSVVLDGGVWPHTWMDARYVAAPVAMLWSWWRKDMLETIAVGMVVMVALRSGLGW